MAAASSGTVPSRIVYKDMTPVMEATQRSRPPPPPLLGLRPSLGRQLGNHYSKHKKTLAAEFPHALSGSCKCFLSAFCRPGNEIFWEKDSICINT